MEEPGEVDKNLEELRAALGARDARIVELSEALEQRDRRMAELNAELEESRIRIWRCLEEHRKEEEQVARVTLDPLTSHPRLLLSPDGRGARWAYGGSEGPFCAVGVSRESVSRGEPAAFSPGAGVWAVQRWGGLGRALTSPPTPLPRLPRRLRVALDYEGGLVAFFDGDSASPTPLFAFPAAAFAGERVRPWFWLELGAVSIEQ
ncbi:PREDICTED: RING finger protein 39-like [Pseudopodoces humilis]|uniref:RING finger protein 39-like n=1 Tax=Pseudopodoces humilis TaxID=181119 RepID=UPI0006B77117|nr:PREDICTED: RING finger protein 39-like [Pseudopodoces humilis]